MIKIEVVRQHFDLKIELKKNKYRTSTLKSFKYIGGQRSNRLITLKMETEFKRVKKYPRPNKQHYRINLAIQRLNNLKIRHGELMGKALTNDFMSMCEGKPTTYSLKALRKLGVLKIYNGFTNINNRKLVSIKNKGIGKWLG